MTFFAHSLKGSVSSCDGAGNGHAGLGIAPNTDRAGHKPSGPTVQLSANAAICKHFYSLACRFSFA